QLQRYSEPKPRRAAAVAHFIDLKNSAHGSSTGPSLMSSLLSPRLSFRSKKGAAVNSPGTLNNSHGAGSYFGSLRNFVAFTGINEEESNGSELRLRKDEKASKLVSGESSSSTRSTRGTSAFGSVGAVSNEVPNSNSAVAPPSKEDLGDYKNLKKARKRHMNDETAELRPILPGFITTCGPIPVVSKFVGPRSKCVPEGSQRGKVTDLSPGRIVKRCDGLIRSSSVSSHGKDPRAEKDDQTKSDGMAPELRAVGSDGLRVKEVEANPANNGGQKILRIQKKLLMERDRPLSPTPLTGWKRCEQEGGDPNGSDSIEQTLPPPSYLIKSLGGQTGPLPIFPLDFMNLKTQDSNSDLTTMTTSTRSVTISGVGCLKSLKERTGEGDMVGSNVSSNKKKTSAEQLNQPAQRAKQAQMIKLWRNSLLDEVESVLNDHESNCRFRNPLMESMDRVCLSKSVGTSSSVITSTETTSSFIKRVSMDRGREVYSVVNRDF
ncbi:expressed protein, partial [Phakopsora pachyrhizi]